MHFTNVSKTEWETLSYLFEVGNVLNSLRGVFVFVLYVLFQRGVRGQLFLRLMKMSSALGIVLQRKGPESASDSTRRIISTQNSTTSTTANTASKRSATDVKQSSTTSETRAPSCTPDEVTEL